MANGIDILFLSFEKDFSDLKSKMGKNTMARIRKYTTPKNIGLECCIANFPRLEVML